jgi:hypothetical protein
MSTRRQVAALVLTLAVAMTTAWLVMSTAYKAEGTVTDPFCVSRAEARSAVVGEKLHHFMLQASPERGALWDGPKSRDVLACDKRDLMRVHTFAPVSEGPLTIQRWVWLHCPQHAPCVVLETYPTPKSTPNGLVLTSHAVVVSSTLPTCFYEDGSGGPRPCTWNVGPQYQPADGLQYWVSGTPLNLEAHYVWNRSPMVNHPERFWSPTQAKCWLDSGTGVGRCANGDRAFTGAKS